MSNYKELSIYGYRGFSTRQTLKIAIPNSKEGSGLTVVVGPNNSGKSTLFEAFRALSQPNPPSFTEGKRNKDAEDKIEITIKDENDLTLNLKSVVIGGSESEFEENGLMVDQVKFVTLASRRTFSPFFGKSTFERDGYIANSNLTSTRGASLDLFSYRLFNIQKNQEAFNKEINKVLGYIPTWVIDQNDAGSYYLKFIMNNTFHNSDGAGEGLLSVFTIVDALYDSKPGELIVIDEPELSLHPGLQRKLFDLFTEFASDRQIIIFTHSPFFINWNILINGGKLSRIVKEGTNSIIYELQDTTIHELSGLLENYNNPHILGLQANEIFFLEDRIVLVEGQEDVIFMKIIMRKLDINLNGTFFGWGIGGADNCDKILKLLQDLGFKKISVILDNNKCEVCNNLQRNYPQYNFKNIPADDIRDKSARNASPKIDGLISSDGKRIKELYTEPLNNIFTEINAYLN